MKKKIMITLDFPPEYGGIQRYLYNIVKHTYCSDDIVVVGSRRNYNYNDKNIPCKVSYFSNPLSVINKKFSLIPLILYLLRFRKKFSGDIDIECGNLYAAIAPLVLNFVYGINYSVFCYGKELITLQKKGLKTFFLRLVLNRAKKLYYISSYTAQLIRKICPEKSLSCLPPKIESIYLLNNDSFGKTYEKLCLLSVGRLVEHKGHEYLIYAAKALPRTIQWTLTIAGSGPCERYLKKLAEKLNVSDKVFIKTSLDDNSLRKEYQKANIFIFPSMETKTGTEGFGIALLEAMAYKLPIIASRTGGIMEVIEYGRCGICVNPGDSDEIKVAILKLVGNQQLREELIKNATDTLLKNYVW